MHPDELLLHYPDIAQWVPHCQFSDCAHDQEPNCAVREAVENGRLAEWRLKNYSLLLARLEDEFYA
jgi:ribosome biogenesis GTPase